MPAFQQQLQMVPAADVIGAYTYTMIVPASVIGLIIGKGGTTVKAAPFFRPLIIALFLSEYAQEKKQTNK